MSDESGQFLDRRPMPVGIKYAIVAGAFTVTWAYLNGDVETATSLSKALGLVLLAFSALELVTPVAEFAGDRLGKWWRGRQSGVEP